MSPPGSGNASVQVQAPPTQGCHMPPWQAGLQLSDPPQLSPFGCAPHMPALQSAGVSGVHGPASSPPAPVEPDADEAELLDADEVAEELPTEALPEITPPEPPPPKNDAGH